MIEESNPLDYCELCSKYNKEEMWIVCGCLLHLCKKHYHNHICDDDEDEYECYDDNE